MIHDFDKVTIVSILESAFVVAFSSLELADNAPIMLVSASRPEFGDYQINGVMPLAKQHKLNPRELATKVIAVATLKLTEIAQQYAVNSITSKLEIAGGGFINITLDDQFLAMYVNQLTAHNKYGVSYLHHVPRCIVVDMSGPNLAKEMHVGHLRSTIIGDAIARMCYYLGDKVIRQNHVGDWGTQFGMLAAYIMYSQLQENGTLDDYDSFLKHAKVTDLEQFYRSAKVQFSEDPLFAEKARRCVVGLQLGADGLSKYYSVPLTGFADFATEAQMYANCWQAFCNVSLKHCNEVYDRLQINWHNPDNIAPVRGESFYNPQLPTVIQRLEQHHLLTESQGAKCVFFAENDLPGGVETPFIVQKQDGAYLYATTDLAALDYRVHTLNADEIIYVVDARQSLHFKQLFLVAKRAQFADAVTQLEHAAFGTMMNEEGKPFKTRDGGTVKLIDLLNEAKNKAQLIVKERNSEWNEVEQVQLANVLSIGAIKYADLAKNRNSDYVFSLNRMLAFEGNTAPYLLYAYTRINSVLCKAHSEYNIDDDAITASNMIIHEVAEHRLALCLSKFAPMLETASRELYPHYVCQYLYELSGLFMQFYEECPILKITDIAIQHSRLKLASIAAQILQVGLEDLLGIQVIKRM